MGPNQKGKIHFGPPSSETYRIPNDFSRLLSGVLGRNQGRGEGPPTLPPTQGVLLWEGGTGDFFGG